MILIIGKAGNYSYLNQVMPITSIEQLKHHYDFSSTLVRAAERAFELGLESCYVCNVQADSDYFQVIDQIKALDIDYILTPELTFKKKLKLKDGRILPIYLIMSELLPDSKFIVTDNHAKDFVSMSHFLSHYNTVRFELNKLAKYKKNIALVANHLFNSDYASVDVACSLLKSEIGSYPELKCGPCVYDLEAEDFRAPITYFKNELALNLFNLDSGIESNLIIERMVQIIKKELDDLFDYLIGRHHTKNTLFTVRYRAEDHLDLRKGRYYENYRIIDVFINNGTIYIDVDIYPYFSFNAIKIRNVIKGR